MTATQSLPVARLETLIPVSSGDVPHLGDYVLGHARAGEWNRARELAADVPWASPAVQILELMCDVATWRDATFDFVASAGAMEIMDLLDMVEDDPGILPIVADAIELEEGALAAAPWHRKVHLAGIADQARRLAGRWTMIG